MCGRFTLTADMFTINAHFELTNLFELSPRYNIAPSQPVLIVRNKADNVRELAQLRWGLVPGWTKADAIRPTLVNARVETVASKPSFRAAFKRQRCLFIASGFYEWQETVTGKQPYFIYHPEDELIAIAGIWDSWHHETTTIESCALLTTDANASVAPIHHRMPVILQQAEFSAWLDRNNQDLGNLNVLLANHRQPNLASHPVSRHVNNARYDQKDCILPLIV
ncbi:MAG: SOS response-associated peptidase [Pseudomonadota bacterium]|nr:SOS response-associated peptidase [Pseudomonadota bacterium]